MVALDPNLEGFGQARSERQSTDHHDGPLEP
jgi:hypothetical protein